MDLQPFDLPEATCPLEQQSLDLPDNNKDQFSCELLRNRIKKGNKISNNFIITSNPNQLIFITELETDNLKLFNTFTHLYYNTKFRLQIEIPSCRSLTLNLRSS